MNTLMVVTHILVLHCIYIDLVNLPVSLQDLTIGEARIIKSCITLCLFRAQYGKNIFPLCANKHR